MGKTSPTKIGGAIRIVKSRKYSKYSLAVWSPKDWKFIETGLEPEEGTHWSLDLYYDKAIERVPCKK